MHATESPNAMMMRTAIASDMSSPTNCLPAGFAIVADMKRIPKTLTALQ
jgi:hypothetical protein